MGARAPGAEAARLHALATPAHATRSASPSSAAPPAACVTGPLQEQEQAALYLVVAELVDRRLLTPKEESQVYYRGYI